MPSIFTGDDLTFDKKRFELLNALIDNFIAKEYKQFFIVRVHRSGVPIYEYAAGENSKPYGLKQDSITPVFSCTKPITAVLIMKL
jgi:CubicO group peptidase (beta-lactamase class C family)